MFKCINPETNEYWLHIEYKEQDYKFFTKRMSTEVGIESWWIWSGDKRLLQLIYNKATKELIEDLLPGQQAKIPKDFMEILQEEFSNRK